MKPKKQFPMGDDDDDDDDDEAEMKGNYNMYARLVLT
jgi:hypothetical protein